MQQQVGKVWSKKRKQSSQSVDVAAIHELNDVSSDEDTSEWSKQTGSMYGSK
jgi:hypothetical protein